MERGNVLLVLLVTICFSGISCYNRQEILINKSVKKLFQPGEIPPVFRKLSEDLDLPRILLGRINEAADRPEPQDTVFCTLCATVADELLSLFRNPNVTQSNIFKKAIELCIELNFGNDVVCNGIINQVEPELTYLFTYAETDGNDLCGMYFMGDGCKSKSAARKWEIELPDIPKPEVDLTPYPDITEDLPTLKILHLTDFHYDPDYSVGSNADCDEMYLCCQEVSSGIRQEGDEAGYWGDYRSCDAPKWTIEAILEDAANTHPDIDYILMTGDQIAHNVWSNSKEKNVEVIRETFDMIEKYFPNIPVMPGVGNHESHPVNSFPQPEFDGTEFEMSWMYDALAEMYQRWIPAEDAITVAKGGHFSHLLQKGLRVISINSNYCFASNWWLIWDSVDVADNLSFLVSELQKSEDAGENVYILTHMTIGSSNCDFSWSHEFNKIMLRYENTVVALFHGHTHKDHFELYYDPEDLSRVYEMGFVGPSQTTYIGKDPHYKIHIAEGNFEGSQFRILDQVSYILNLKEANENIEKKPVLKKLYSFLDYYGLTDMSPQSMAGLIESMRLPDSPEFEKFYSIYNPDDEEPCEGSCKTSLLCRMVTSDNSDHAKCDSM